MTISGCGRKDKGDSDGDSDDGVINHDQTGTDGTTEEQQNSSDAKLGLVPIKLRPYSQLRDTLLTLGGIPLDDDGANNYFNTAVAGGLSSSDDASQISAAMFGSIIKFVAFVGDQSINDVGDDRRAEIFGVDFQSMAPVALVSDENRHLILATLRSRLTGIPVEELTGDDAQMKALHESAKELVADLSAQQPPLDDGTFRYRYMLGLWTLVNFNPKLYLY